MSPSHTDSRFSSDRERPARNPHSRRDAKEYPRSSRSRSPRSYERGERDRSDRTYPQDSASDRGSSTPKPKETPNYGLSGALAAETNTENGVVLKYHEPNEARKATTKWRLYVFKEEREIDMIRIFSQSAYLFGRDRLVVDIPIEHSSCSKQHAVIQHREVLQKNEFGDKSRAVKPYLIDLDSSNGTTLNGKSIPPSRYVELHMSDVIQFGHSTREYVLLAE